MDFIGSKSNRAFDIYKKKLKLKPNQFLKNKWMDYWY